MSSLYCVRPILCTMSTVMTIAVLMVLLAGTLCQAANPPACSTGVLPPGNGGDVDITGGTCFVDSSNSPYQYGNINIYGAGKLCFVDSGDGKNIEFWAKSILVESNGSLLSSDATKCSGGAASVFGASGATLTIHLYGPDQGTGQNGGKGPGQGIQCHSGTGSGGTMPCGVPGVLWNSNPMTGVNPSTCVLAKDVAGYNQNLPGNVNDCFYGYMPLTYDNGGNPPGYFGYKVLAVSYGGTLQLFGKKGSLPDPQLASSSGTSWARLTTTLAGTGAENQFTIDRKVDWAINDKIVVTTTDYVASHSEQLTIMDISTTANSSTITTQEKIQFPHNGQTYDLGTITDNNIGPEQDPSVTCSGKQTRCVETRAAVGLLTRSVRIVSEGDTYDGSNDGKGKGLPPPGTQCSNPDPGQPNSCLYFGGHTMFRQGFAAVQIRGVEFYQLGQGGRIMHYPVHFHMARKTPQPVSGNSPVTFVEDSSVWDSMTRWMVLHATHGVTLARNVGYLSIGHGYYLEDATEINNKLYSNLGVLARAAVVNPQNPRQVPGILAAAYGDPAMAKVQEQVPFHSDIDHPTVFWISNGWNDFQHNMAAGAGSCGACYWFVPAANSTMSRYEKWWSYASEQKWIPAALSENSVVRAAMTPLQNFEGNSCASAMNAFNTIGNTTACEGVVRHVPSDFPRMLPVDNPLAPLAPDPPSSQLSPAADAYYPQVTTGGGRFATQCPPPDPMGNETDCSTVTRCNGSDVGACMVTAIDHFTTSFNFTETGFAAMWLRPEWYLVSNSAITDVQLGGVTFVTGGGYTQSDVVKGHWAIARNDVFIGNTQPAPPKGSPYAENAGPFNGDTLAKDPNFKCALQNNAATGQYCLYAPAGLTMPLSNFGVGQRLFNIYDGPAYEENNAFLDITHTNITDCTPTNGGGCSNSKWMYGVVQGMPLDAKGACYLPNAAIAWKQPNGFFYPPTFHSNNLFFNNVDIRHFVIEPLFDPGTYDINQDGKDGVVARYCTYANLSPTGTGLFTGYTDVDRQTELSDDDGSLTGLINTISVNKDPFFAAPVEDIECASDIADNLPPVCDKSSEICGTAKTSPYAYVTTVVYPHCTDGCGYLTEAQRKAGQDYLQWFAQSCTNQFCFGVPMYREDITKAENNQPVKPFIRLSGQSIGQRSSLTVNHGSYYIDTTIPEATQRMWSEDPNNPSRVSVFKGPVTDNDFIFNGTYYTFLLFAKPKPDKQTDPPATRQTYSMYVGTNFNYVLGPNGDIWAVQVDIATDPFKITPGKGEAGQIPWPNTWSTPTLSADGVLTVTMDMSFADFGTKYKTALQDHCLPATFCSWTNNSCGCALNSVDKLYSQCQAVCSAWTNKDSDCPDGGCYGFAVKLPQGFENIKNKPGPPAPMCYPDNNDWNVPFQPADMNKAGSCFYSMVPTGDFCNNLVEKAGNTR